MAARQHSAYILDTADKQEASSIQHCSLGYSSGSTTPRSYPRAYRSQPCAPHSRRRPTPRDRRCRLSDQPLARAPRGSARGACRTGRARSTPIVNGPHRWQRPLAMRFQELDTEPPDEPVRASRTGAQPSGARYHIDLERRHLHHRLISVPSEARRYRHRRRS